MFSFLKYFPYQILLGEKFPQKILIKTGKYNKYREIIIKFSFRGEFKMIKVAQQLVQIASELDTERFYKEANEITKIISRLAQINETPEHEQDYSNMDYQEF